MKRKKKPEPVTKVRAAPLGKTDVLVLDAVFHHIVMGLCSRGMGLYMTAEVDSLRADHDALKSAIATLLRDLEPADLPGRGPAILLVRSLISEES